MKKELEEQLVKKYPKIMKNYCGDPKKTCFAFGFENDNGWYDLIDNLCFSIQSHIDYSHKIEQVVIDQVKEKFSTLRFYYTGGDEFIKGVVSLATEMSSLFCEVCGTNQNVNRITHRARIKTICKTCEKGWRK